MQSRQAEAGHAGPGGRPTVKNLEIHAKVATSTGQCDEEIRKIAEEAFRKHYGDIELVRVNIKHGLDFYGDPMVELRYVYDDKRGKVGSLGGDRGLRLLGDVSSPFEAGPKGPVLVIPRYIALSELGKRDPASA